jgi:hypothetical protein
MNVTLITLPPARVVYLRYTGPYGPEIGTFWRETVAPWIIENNLLNRVRYGIGHDDPSTTPAQYCRYDACVEVPADFEPDYHSPSLICLAGATPSPTSKAQPTRFLRHGERCVRSGCQKADWPTTSVRVSSGIRWRLLTMRTLA